MNIGGGGGLPDAASLARVDVYLRFGDSPAPTGRPDLKFDDEHLTWSGTRSERRASAATASRCPRKLVYLEIS